MVTSDDMNPQPKTIQEVFNELGDALEELRYQIYLEFFKPVFDWINKMVRKYGR